MRKLSKVVAILTASAILTVGGYAYGSSRVPASAHRATYALQSDLWGYPYTLKLRHCAVAEDTLGTLKMVDYRPADSVVVYRCKAI